jgi:hypothetical protein
MAERMGWFPRFAGQAFDMLWPGDVFNPRAPSFGDGLRTSDWGRAFGGDLGAGVGVLTDVLLGGVPIVNLLNRGGTAGNFAESVIDKLLNRNNANSYNSQHSMPSFNGFSPYGPYAGGYELPPSTDGSSTSESVMGYLGMNDYSNPGAYVNNMPVINTPDTNWQNSGINGGFGSWGGGGGVGGVGGGFGMGGAGIWTGSPEAGSAGPQSKFASKWYFDIE